MILGKVLVEDCRVPAPSLSLSSSPATGEWLWSVVHSHDKELHLLRPHSKRLFCYEATESRSLSQLLLFVN